MSNTNLLRTINITPNNHLQLPNQFPLQIISTNCQSQQNITVNNEVSVHTHLAPNSVTESSSNENQMLLQQETNTHYQSSEMHGTSFDKEMMNLILHILDNPPLLIHTIPVCKKLERIQ